MSARGRCRCCWKVGQSGPGLLWMAVAACSVLAGCNVAPARPKAEALASAGSTGRLVEAKRCTLTVVILTRPQGDAVLNEVAWQSADEQVIEPDLRRALQTNGLRLGRLTGEVPSALAEMLHAGPPNQPDVQMIANPSGESALVDPSQAPAHTSLNLLLSDPQGQVRGKNYSDAKGFLRVTATHEGSSAVSVRLAPELHHGPVLAGFGPVSTGPVLMPREFQMTAGQKQETFRDLAATVALQPGQILLIGTRPERPGCLGDLLFNRLEANSDRVRQSLVLIWANRNGAGELAKGRLDLPPALRPVDDAELDTATRPAPAPTSAGQTPTPEPGSEAVPALESEPDPSPARFPAEPTDRPEPNSVPASDPFGAGPETPGPNSPSP